MKSSNSDRYILSPLFLVASLRYNIVPKGRLRISRQLGDRALLEDREVSMLNCVLEFRICGWLDNESGSRDGMLVGAGHHFIFLASKSFVYAGSHIVTDGGERGG